LAAKKSKAIGEPSTMGELLASTGYKIKGFKRGDVVTGKVITVTGKAVLIDIGGKAEATVSEQEYELSRDYLRALKPGDSVTGIVLVPESDSGQVVLSLKRAAADQRWKAMEKAMEEGSAVKVTGKDATKGGLLVDVDGLYGFVPASQVSREWEGNVAGMVGRTFEVKVIEVDRGQNRLVMSEKVVGDEEEIEKRKLALSRVKIGGGYLGKVVGIVPFGAFVEINTGGKEDEKLEGLVHISEISWEKVDDVNKSLKEGDEVQVQVIGSDEETGKLALSMKRLSADPWLVVAKKYSNDSKHRGVVTKIAPYGVLVRLEKGIEGLIHASKMPANMSFKDGDEIEVFVESVDLDKRRLSLGVVAKDTKEMIYK